MSGTSITLAAENSGVSLTGSNVTWVIVAVGTVHPHWEPYLQPGAALSA